MTTLENIELRRMARWADRPNPLYLAVVKGEEPRGWFHGLRRAFQRFFALLFAFSAFQLFSFSAFSQIVFTRAPVVTNGAPVLAKQWNTQAKAIRDRIESGVADPVWRVFYKAHSLMREINLDYAQEDFFWECAMHMGTNLVEPNWDERNPVVKFLFGDGSDDAWHESERLQQLPPISAGLSVSNLWEAAKAQRGVAITSPEESYATAPALLAARSWRGQVQRKCATEMLVTYPYHTFLTTFGGWLGAPDTNYVFKGLHGATDLNYDASPLVGNTVSLDVDAYYVNGPHAADWLPFSHYLFGPHKGPATLQLGAYPISGGVPAQSLGKQLDEVLQWHGSSLAGSWQERTNEARYSPDIEFDWARFFTNQYRLAPAYQATYPVLDLLSGMTTNFTAHAGFRPAAVRLMLGASSAQALDPGGEYSPGDVVSYGGSCWVALFSQSGAITPDSDPDAWAATNCPPGAGSAIVKINGSRVRLDGMKVKWLDGATALTLSNAGPGEVIIEVAELEDRKPALEDGYLVARWYAGVTNGLAVATPHRFSDKYFEDGCLVGDGFPGDQSVQTSAIYDATRRFLRRYMRALNRWSDLDHSRPSLVDCTNNAQGHAVLVFNRRYKVGTNEFDVFDGLGPALRFQTNGLLDTGTYGEGISNAGPCGFDNQWVMMLSSAFYGTNTFEYPSLVPHDYADQMTFLVNRGLTLNWDMRCGDNELRYLVDPQFRGDLIGEAPVIRAEAPSYFTYSRGLNRFASNEFYSSCEIYPEPYRIVSAVQSGSNLVLTLDRILQTAINGARCDSNVVFDYFNLSLHGISAPLRIGDTANDAWWSGANCIDFTPRPADLCGACLPRFYFLRLPVLVYENAADPYDRHTRVVAEQLQYEVFLLSAMCEGWVDPQSVNLSNCQAKACFTWENLCYLVAGQRWQEQYGQESWGPWPNTSLDLNAFNLVSDAVNALSEAPVEPAINLYQRNIDSYGRTHYPWDAGYGSVQSDGCASTLGICDTQDGSCASLNSAAAVWTVAGSDLTNTPMRS